MQPSKTLRLRVLTLGIAACLASGASAQSLVVFSSTGGVKAVTPGQVHTQKTGVTQLRRADGSIVSVVGPAAFQIRADGSFELITGSVTAVAGSSSTRIHLPLGGSMQLGAGGNSGNVTVNGVGVTGGALNGQVTISGNKGSLTVKSGEFWSGLAGGTPAKTLGNSGVAVPSSVDHSNWLALYLMTASTGALGQAMDATAVEKLLQFQAFVAKGGTPSDWKGGDIKAILAAYSDWAKRTGASGIPVALDNFLKQLASYFASGKSIDAYPELPLYQNYTAALDALRQYLMNGGVPSQYGALTADQIKAMLAMLQQTGSFSSFFNANGAFWGQYLSWVNGSNNPDAFPGLPESLTQKLDRYQTALDRMYAWIAAGHAPSAYGELSLAQMEEYLVALESNGRLNTMPDPKGEFWRLYVAYLTNTDKPADLFYFLPMYEQSIDSLKAYYTYLIKGGKPSEYTAASQESLYKMMQMLSEAGRINSFGDPSVFMADFYAYLSKGGIANDYPNLPKTPTPGGGAFSVASVQVVSAANMPGAFNGMAGSSATATTLTANETTKAITGEIPNQSAVSVIKIPTDAKLLEHGELTTGVGYGRLVSGDSQGRFSFDGKDYAYTANHGLHYAYVPELTSMPQPLILKYKLAGATKPTTNSGSNPAGTFDATAAIAFTQAKYRIGMEGSLVMPGDATYTFQTDGGLKAVEINGYDSDGSSSGMFSMFMFGTGRSCPAKERCSIDMWWKLGGSTANFLATSYRTRSSATGDGIVGAAIFTQDGIYTPPPLPTVELTKFAGNKVEGLVGLQLVKKSTSFTSSVNSTGYWTRFDGSSKLLEVAQTNTLSGWVQGASTETNAGHDGDKAAWITWRDGIWGAGDFSSFTVLRSIDPSRIPAVGTTVNYNLLPGAGLAPTRKDSNGNVVNGSVTSGKAAVSFANSFSALFGMELNLAMNSANYAFSTSGGIAKPSVTLQQIYVGDNRGYTATYAMRATDNAGGLCSGSQCLATGSVLLGGTSADQLAVSYVANNHTDVRNNFGGIVVFDKATAPSSSAMPSPETAGWGRWTGPVLPTPTPGSIPVPVPVPNGANAMPGAEFVNQGAPSGALTAHAQRRMLDTLGLDIRFNH